MWCFLLCLHFLGTLVLCTFPAIHRPLHEYAPGDIIIGGLFPIHSEPNHTFPSSGHVSCKGYRLQLFLCAQMMIFAINGVNQRKSLPNVTLGYDVYDTCGDVSLAMRMALDMSIDKSNPRTWFLPQGKPTTAPDPRVKVVIGEGSSEVSIAVARILTLSSITQISYASSSELLSRKSKFPTFLRTVNSDVVQTKAIAELVKKFKWETVGIVGSDDEYGRYGSESLVGHFNAMHVCLDFKVILPAKLDRSESRANIIFNNLMDTIQNSTAEAIILFTKESNVKLVLKSAIQKNLNRTWIASDSWSNSDDIKELPGIEAIGSFFGIVFKSQIFAGFADYVSSMVKENSSLPLWEYHLLNHPPCSSAPQKAMDCSLTGNKCMETRCLVRYIFWDLSLNIYLAIEAIAKALSSLMKCDKEQCQRNTSFTAYELFNEIKNVKLTVNNTQLEFDENGDPMLGYDIIAWNSTSSENIGEYAWGNIHLFDHIDTKIPNVMVTAFSCFKKCPAGHELIGNGKSCCKHCHRCRDGYFSPGSAKTCTKCKKGEYPSSQYDKCLVKQPQYPEWNDPFIITLSVFNILGIVATITVVVIFVVNRSTPIVKAVGGYLCFLELFSLLACFCLSFTFTLKPSKISCVTGMPLFGIAFTLCVSCILANLLQILVGFNFAQNMGGWLRRVNQPPAVVAILFGIQLLLCSIWLVYYPPSLQKQSTDKAIELNCNPTSKALFGAMLSYVALLAIVCFLFAFNGKKLPDLYKNASFVTIGMLLVLVVWIIFIPVYLYGSGEYTEAIKAAAVLVSSHSMLCCHLIPKCYIMVCRKELNDEKAITDYIRNHYEQKGINVLKS